MHANVHLSREVNVIQSAIVPSKKKYFFSRTLTGRPLLSINQCF